MAPPRRAAARADLSREVDFPVANADVGLTKRVQFGFSVPVLNAGAPGGPWSHGLGDLYVYSKVQLRDPASKKGAGYAVTPS